ncbi:MAG: hypothetical protein AB7T86_02620 [Xanthobacteraceae bacterium]|uniref:hypothetical protein n=1 Tax=Pseudolabrys sp. TaxID=1960880 RepID=UPI003D141319
MADYLPLVTRAVGGLERNTAENRRALYERARSALVAQLRGMDPPLDEADITRERLALEEAIRRVESDAARKPRVDEVPPPPPGFDEDDHAGSTTVEDERPSLTDQGLKGFRDVVAEAEGLGDASAKASRAAREFYDRAPDRDPPAPPAPAPDTPAEAPPEIFDAGRTTPEPEGGPAVSASEGWQPPPPRHGRGEDFEGPKRSYRGLIRALVILVVLGAVAAAGYWQRDQIMSLASSMMTKTQTPAKTQAPTEAAKPQGQSKIADRVGSDSRPSQSATAPAAAVAQKVVLYEEDSSNPQGKRFVGSAIWKTETVSPGPGLAPELVIKAEVDIPERHMRMVWSLRRNTDKALPASHTIEIMFTLPADFPEGAINNVPGVLMKQNEQTRGVPLAGLAVKVTNGFFLVGLSSVEVDRQRNIQLLKDRDWFDVPIVYTSGKRAILAVEKGQPGERAFEEAFRAWGE